MAPYSRRLVIVLHLHQLPVAYSDNLKSLYLHILLYLVASRHILGNQMARRQ